jgi:glycosyltransferase involved in cell wall biosynthesis
VGPADSCPCADYGDVVRIAWLNWRDTANPEGGGSEVYLETIAAGLVARGHEVTIVCAAHDQAPPDEWREGIRFIRRGNKLTVYSAARRILRSGHSGPFDVVVDTHNGIPFLSPWATRTPVVVLVHHVHREQWPVVYDPIRARVGWWLESRLSPWVYRASRYIAVSAATRAELVELGVSHQRIDLVHNGTPTMPEPQGARSPTPHLIVLGRLVPHKRVEHVLRAVSCIRRDIPDLTVSIVGDGWWAPTLHAIVDELGLGDIVTFTGAVDEQTKAAELARAWVLALPSLKEGWGLVVMEAAAFAVPSVAYVEAGGVTESIRDGRTGVLVSGGEADFTAALANLLSDHAMRQALGAAAQEHSRDFTWEASTLAFEKALDQAVAQSKNKR